MQGGKEAAGMQLPFLGEILLNFAVLSLPCPVIVIPEIIHAAVSSYIHSFLPLIAGHLLVRGAVPPPPRHPQASAVFCLTWQNWVCRLLPRKYLWCQFMQQPRQASEPLNESLCRISTILRNSQTSTLLEIQQVARILCQWGDDTRWGMKEAVLGATQTKA